MQAQGGGFGAGAGGGGGGGGGQHQALAPKAKYICGGERPELGADPGGARNARAHNGIAREHFVRTRAHALARALQRVKGGAGDGRRPARRLVPSPTLLRCRIVTALLSPPPTARFP